MDIINQSNRLLSDEIKWGIIIGHKYYNQSYDELIKTFDLKSKGTITKILDKYRSQNNVENNFSYSGQQGIQNKECMELVKDAINDLPYIKYSVKNIMEYFNYDYSEKLSQSSIYMLMKDIECKYGRLQRQHQLSELNLLERKEFCKKWAYQSLSEFVFTDESIFSLKDNKIDIWYCDEFEKIIRTKELAWSQNQIHVWAGVSSKGKTQLYIFDSSVNSEAYQKCIDIAYKPFLQNNHQNLILLQDGAKSHTSASTKDYFKQNNIKFQQNPAWSPDLNAVELIWSRMKYIFTTKKTNKTIQNKDQLIQLVNEIWITEIQQNFIDSCIEHVSNNMKQVFEENGMYLHK